MAKMLMYESELLERVRASIRQAKEFAFGMALISRSGLDLIEQDLRGCLERRGGGRILIGIDLPTEPEAIERLYKLQQEFLSQLQIRIFQSSPRRFFHPKLSVFRSRQGQLTAIVGSANLTNGGLVENYEVSTFIDEQFAARACLAFFDENFKGGYARRVDSTWLDRYKSVFDQRLKARKAFERARRRALRLRARRIASKPLPPRIRGYKFGFTGKIEDWPRDSKLYPFIRRQGGAIAAKPSALHDAACLVHGEILGGKKSTRKLAAAEGFDIPVISPEAFFKIADREKGKKARR
jgi:HKD family nuclease